MKIEADFLPPTELRLTLVGDTSHLEVSDLVKLGHAINALLVSPGRETRGQTPRIKWVIMKVEKDD